MKTKQKHEQQQSQQHVHLLSRLIHCENIEKRRL